MTSNDDPTATGDGAAAPFQERLAAPEHLADRIDPSPTPGVAVREAPVAAVDEASLVAELLRQDRRTFGTALADVRRFVQDDGITWGTTDDDSPGRPWLVDPLPVVLTAGEWSGLERGLQQRARVLGLVLDDLYSHQRLLHEGVLSPRAVLGHPGYVRPAFGTPPARRPLTFTATDLGRDADGNWNVLGDRTQAPEGAGYAMATRRVVSRILPRLHRATEMSTLLGFFHSMASAVRHEAPPGDAPPRAVMLGPGPDDAHAFDQAFTASLLGIPLVEADDLTVREGRPWLRGSHGLVPVDVIVRRVEETLSDPLDLRGDSSVGVPGLLESVRLGNATVMNPIGAGVLENGAIVAAFDRLTREMLGEEPLLPSPPTWWCGDETSLQHVLANLEQLLIKPTNRGRGPSIIEGWMLAAAERDELRARIAARPWEWVGQEPLPMSTSSIVTESGVESRNFALRAFGVQVGDEHVVMRGGLGRVSAKPGERTVSTDRGTIAKDVWVLGGEPAASYPWLPATHERRSTGAHASLFETTPRGADNLYWFGRYAERTDGIARLLAVANDLAGDHSMHPATPGARALEAVLEAVEGIGQIRARHEDESVVDYLRHLVVDTTPRGTLAATVERVGRAAQGVRELVSGDVWAVLATLERTLGEIPDDADELQPHFDALLVPILALQGITSHGMFRDATWAFIDTGIRMERAQFLLTLLRRVLVPVRPVVAEFLVTEAVLAVGDSTISHRRRLAAADGPSMQVESALELLVAEPGNPRSVAFQIDRIAGALEVIGDVELAESAAQLAQGLKWLDLARISDDREALDSELGAALDELRTLNQRLTARHFRRQAPHHAVQPQRWAVSERWLTP